MKYAWIDGHRDSFALEALCGTLDVSASGFAAWKRGGSVKRWLTDAQMLVLIRAIFAESDGNYGSPRVYREIKARGLPGSRERVARLMNENGIRAKHKRRYKATTDSKHNLPVAPNLLDQNFEASAPDQTWTTDITYVPTGEGWLYLAVVLDLYTRMVVGWSMQERMTRELVIDALRMAWFRRCPKPGLVHHSDRGSQYCSHDYQAVLKEYGMLASMSRKGNCWDNAVTESFFGSLKNERVHHRRYATRAQAKQDLFEYIEAFYNRRRRHSALRYTSPVAYHAAWIAQQKRAA